MSRVTSHIGLISTSRSWIFVANIAARGTGFLMTFLISRVLGTHALGEYSSLMSTVSSAIQPFAQATSNNTILLVHRVEDDAASVRSMTIASLLVTIGLSAISLLIFLTLRRVAESHDDGTTIWLDDAAGAAFVIGQLAGAVLLGAYYGTGKFVEGAKLSTVASVFTIVAAPLAIVTYGLSGAYVMVAFSALMPPCALAYRLFSLSGAWQAFRAADFMPVARQFVTNLPSIARAGVATASFWLCTVFFVQQSFGVEGVGVVAVAVQWLTFILLATSSWHGLTLKALAEAASSRKVETVTATMRSLLKRNLLVTVAGALSVAAAADIIADSYGLGHTQLALLLRLNCCVALIAACNETFEQLMLALNLQSLWFLSSLAAFGVQVGITAVFINTGLPAVIWASLAGAGTLLLCCTLACMMLAGKALQRSSAGALNSSDRGGELHAGSSRRDI